MKSYELVYLVAGDTSEMDQKKIQKKVLEIVTKNGGKVIKEDFWGKKPLAYQIKKQDYAFYTVLLLDLAPDKVGQLESDLKLTEKIIRHLISIKEGIKVKKGAKRSKPKKVVKSVKKIMKPVEVKTEKPKIEAIKPEKPEAEPKIEKPKIEKPKIEKPKPEEKESLTEKDKKEILEEKERESALDKKLEEILKEE